MKKIIAAILTALLLLTSCSAETGSAEQGLSVVCTVFPVYDWVREILGENPANVEPILLTENGEELHSYQPTAEDLIRIYGADLFLYVGGESDQWAEALSPEEDRKAASLLLLLKENVKTEETVEGMEGEADGAADEHVWLSLSNAKAAVGEIAALLGGLDPENAGIYAANAEAYSARLDELDGEYRAVVEDAAKKTLIFGDRFPFRYLVDDYGLEYYAAFPGCSAETEASFETVIFLAEKTDELGAEAVLTLEGSDRRIAEAIIRNTEKKDLPILTLDSMQSVALSEAESGTTYLSIARKNLETLREALGGEGGRGA